MLGAPFQSFTVPTRDGHTLHVETCGHGEPALLFVHGFAEGSYVWRDSMLALAPNAKRFALDLRGHGASTWQADGCYLMAGLVNDVEAVLAAIGTSRCVLVGHSLGGNVALRVAARQGKCIGAVIVVDTEASPSAIATEQVRKGLRETAERRWTLAAYIDWLAARRPLAPPATLEYLAQHSLSMCEDGTFAARVDPRLNDFEQADGSLWTVLGDVRRPVLLLRGAYSGVLSNDAAHAMVARLPDACLRTVARAGHGVMVDNPTDFFDAVRSFFEDRSILEVQDVDRARAQDGASTPDADSIASCETEALMP